MKNTWKQELLLLICSLLAIMLCYKAFTHQKPITWKHLSQKDIPFEIDYSNNVQPKIDRVTIAGKQTILISLGTTEGEGVFISVTPQYRSLPDIIESFYGESVFIKKISLSGYDAAVFKEVYYPREPHPHTETVAFVAQGYEYQILINSLYTQHILDSFKITENTHK
jgi:hypothetical protein